MVLDTVYKSIEVILDEVAITTECDITSVWADATDTTFVPGSSDLDSDGITAVTAVAAPTTGGVRRMVKAVRVVNLDTIAHTVTIRIYNSAASTRRVIIRDTIAPDADLVYIG